MIATVFLKPCPICPRGKNCKGHVDDKARIISGYCWIAFALDANPKGNALRRGRYSIYRPSR